MTYKLQHLNLLLNPSNTLLCHASSTLVPSACLAPAPSHHHCPNFSYQQITQVDS